MDFEEKVREIRRQTIKSYSSLVVKSTLDKICKYDPIPDLILINKKTRKIDKKLTKAMQDMFKQCPNEAAS